MKESFNGWSTVAIYGYLKDLTYLWWAQTVVVLITTISGNEDAVTKQISALHTTLSGLRRYTNYSVTVCAFTAAGDGVRAAPVYCHTEEDGTYFLLQSAFLAISLVSKAQNRNESLIIYWTFYVKPIVRIFKLYNCDESCLALKVRNEHLDALSCIFIVTCASL